MEVNDSNLYQLIRVLEEHGNESMLAQLAYEIGSSRIKEVIANCDEEKDSRIQDLMSKVPDRPRRRVQTYYDMQTVGNLSEVMSISKSYISNMANNRNANHLHIEREIQRVTSSRTFYSYRIEPGFDISLKDDPELFEKDMVRFMRRSIIRFAEENLKLGGTTASFTVDAFMARFSKEKKPLLYEPYKDALKRMIQAKEITKSGLTLTLAPELVGTQEGCTVPKLLQSELWKALESS